MAEKKKLSLTAKMFISMVLAVLAGFIFGEKITCIQFIGNAWLSVLKMTIAPFILLTLVTSIGGTSNPSTIGKTAVRIVCVYIFTTVVAALVGITTATLTKAGMGFTGFQNITEKIDLEAADLSFQTYFSSLFADNFFKAFVENKILQIVVISILMGTAILKLPQGENKASIINWFKRAQEVFNQLIVMIISVGPIGIFCLMSSMIGRYGQEFIGGMAGLIGSIYLGLVLQVLICYVPLIWIFARITPFQFIKRSLPLCIYTCSTCSSVASIPVNKKTCIENFGVEEETASFTIPLGSQINMDSNAVFYPCILLFIAQSMGIRFSFFQLFQMVLFTSLIASGGGGLPGSGIVKIMVVVEAFGFPAEIAAIISSFYAVLDMGLTTGACWGDLTGTVIVDRMNKRSRSKLENIP